MPDPLTISSWASYSFVILTCKTLRSGHRPNWRYHRACRPSADPLGRMHGSTYRWQESWETSKKSQVCKQATPGMTNILSQTACLFCKPWRSQSVNWPPFGSFQVTWLWSSLARWTMFHCLEKKTTSTPMLLQKVANLWLMRILRDIPRVGIWLEKKKQ